MERMIRGLKLVAWSALMMNLTLMVMGCGGVQLPPCEPCPTGTVGCQPYCFATPSPSPSATPTPVPTPTPSPSPSPSPTPSASPTPSPSPSPSPSASPTPVPTPPPSDCSQFKPDDQGWGLLTCVANGRQVCGAGTQTRCGCDGDGCGFNIAVGTKCAGDSTPRYKGLLPNWKTCICADLNDDIPCEEWPTCATGTVSRSEYPPGPSKGNPNKGEPPHPGYYGWDCLAETVWSSAPKGVTIKPEANTFGAAIHFDTRGTFKICASRKGMPDKNTCKTANVR